ncbi:MAG: glycoside hydrolase family 2 TIM barrel-domain containing protein [Solirubrobacteraceae bacterium]|nr:glycoside hydrolase family 2 TIM barrel-domain containing protein [Solirubrobacteraceae bacterium]
MLRRLLPPALLLVVACAVALTLALQGEDPVTTGDGASAADSVTAALSQTGAGPAGSAIAVLDRWRYRADPDDRGRDRGWARGRWRGTPVRVPHSPNAGAYNGTAGQRAYDGSVGWFATDIEAPAAGLYAVRFESAHHRARVYVDGRPVREHVGAYEPFSARVALEPGRHTIAVRVDWRGPRRQADSGWARAWFNYGGLNRPVTIARLGRSELGALSVRTRLQDGGERATVQIGVRVRNRGASRTLRPRGSIALDGRNVRTLDFGQAGVSGGTSRALTTTVTIDDPQLWSPDSPRLYDLRVDVPGEATLRRKIGLREISWDSIGLQVNGERLTLRGASLPPDVRGRGDAMTGADEQRVVAGLRAIGANATRTQLPLSESMLARLDHAGILVWQEVGPWEPGGRWRAESPQQIAAARDRALRVAEAGQANPSILTWTLTNEVAGNGQPGQQEYIRQTARSLRELDPTRPVAADLWGRVLPNRAGVFADLDAIGMTDYIGWYEGLDRDAAEQAQITRERLARLRGFFPDKPIVITELGAAGTAVIGGDAFGSLRFQADLLGRRLRELRGAPNLSGTLIWNLRDYALRPDFRGGSVLELRPDLTLTPGLNEKGLYDFAGRPKPALAAVRDALREP